MCGICGIICERGVNPDEVRRMADVLAHRGPDDQGYYVNGQVGLGHRRLSIIDLAHGQQPISNQDGTIWVVFNGEIYNFKSLRQELEAKGYVFKTHTDTEVIVHLYQEMGERCLEKLSGMFAFALWDAKQRKLFMARDRLGQKPLFYSHIGDRFLFASETKGILAADNVGREMNLESIHHYLSLRFIPTPDTMLRSVNKLPPGHSLTYQDGRVTISRYWDLSFADKLTLSEDDILQALDEKLKQVVDAHLVSDVPVGAFLSGGIDSSMVVALMAEIMGRPFKTFAVGSTAADYSEIPFARMVAERYRTEQIEEVVDPDLVTLIPKMIWHLDEPSDPIAACMFHSSRLASRHVKVVLGGDGGDELFAGYDRYAGVQQIDHYARIPSLFRSWMIGPLIRTIPDSFTYKSLASKLQWVHQLSAYQHHGERYAQATAFFRFPHQAKQALYSESLWRELGGIQSTKIIVDQFDRADADNSLDRMLYADSMTRLPEHELMLNDRMSMAHGLETRSPFLDHGLAEFVARIPSNLKIRGRTLKYILRQVAHRYLPQAIFDRPKQGFMFPVAYWFRNELYAFARESLLNASFVREGLFRRDNVLKLIEDHRNNRVDNHVRIWMLLNLEIWHRMYIEGQSMTSVQDQIGEQLVRLGKKAG